MEKRLLMLLSLALLWLVVSNATCHSKRQQAELMNSYQLALFNLTEAKDMGADRFEPDIFEEAVLVGESIEEMLSRERWSQASKTIPYLQQTIAQLIDRMKDRDPDGDGLSNYAEFMMYGTSWTDSDSDRDGYFDGSEILHYQTDPLDYCSVPEDVPPETIVQQFCEPKEKQRSGN